MTIPLSARREKGPKLIRPRTFFSLDYCSLYCWFHWSVLTIVLRSAILGFPPNMHAKAARARTELGK